MIDSVIGLLIYCTLYNWFQGNNHPFNAIAIVCIISVSISIESTTGKAVAGPILQNLGSFVVSVPVLFPLAACSCFTGQC